MFLGGMPSGNAAFGPPISMPPVAGTEPASAESPAVQWLKKFICDLGHGSYFSLHPLFGLSMGGPGPPWAARTTQAGRGVPSPLLQSHWLGDQCPETPETGPRNHWTMEVAP